MRSVTVRTPVEVERFKIQDLYTMSTVFLPDHPVTDPVVLFLFPGAGYGRSYFDLKLEGGDSYSQAAYHTSRGRVVVACDHLGVGESTVPNEYETAQVEDLASANEQTVRFIDARLGAGLAPGIEPIPARRLIGMGQSMGGYLLTVLQGIYETFSAVGFLGWTNIHCEFPDPGGGRVQYVGPARGSDAAAETLDIPFAYEALRYCYHYDDVPEAIVKTDLAPLADPGLGAGDAPWRSATTPLLAITGTSRAPAGPEAARITTPVLIAAGERDVIPDPRMEPTAYPRSDDVTLCVIPRMSHMHNFASSREMLWRRIEGWIDGIV